MEQELRAILLAASSVTDVVVNRINWGSIPQGQPYPSVAMHVIDEVTESTMTGPDGLFQGRVQIDCYALTYSQSKILARAIIAVLDGYRGGVFSGIFLASARDSRESGTNEADRPFRVSLDFATNRRLLNE
jgi:hypothetical protein